MITTTTLFNLLSTAITNEDYKLLQATLRQCRKMGLTNVRLTANKETLIKVAADMMELV